jgi:hypothetical protein
MYLVKYRDDTDFILLWIPVTIQQFSSCCQPIYCWRGRGMTVRLYDQYCCCNFWEMYLLYFQVSNGLLGRVTQANQNFNKEIELKPRVSPEFELTLDSTPAQHSIQTMNFFQMKGQWNIILPDIFFCCILHKN